MSTRRTKIVETTRDREATRMWTRRAVAGACVADALVACSPSEDEAVDSLAEVVAGLDDGPELTDSELRCVSVGVVESLGAERSLRISGADLDGDLGTTEADAVANAYLECADVDTYFRELTRSDSVFVGEPQEYVDCYVEEAAINGWERLLEVRFEGGRSQANIAASVDSRAYRACFGLRAADGGDES